MKKILIVDDNEQNLYMLNALLQGHNFEVETALNGEDALGKAREAPPDLLVTDILMPVMDGYSLCREWKKDSFLKNIPFIFYTATYTDPKDEEFALSLGAERFILKPAEPEIFITTLQEVLSEFENGELSLSQKVLESEPEYQQKYSERLVRKLEKKMMDLQEANKALTEEVEKRKKAEKLWEKTFNSIDHILTVQDKDMRIVQVNKAALQFFEAQPEDLIGKKCHEIFHGEPQPCLGCPELETLRDHINHTEIIEHEHLGKIFNVSSSAIFDDDGNLQYLVHIAKDITEQKKLEEDLFQSQKMEAIGTLSGGIAHDFNNILSAIIGYSELSLQHLSIHSKAADDINQVIKSAKRAADLILQILTFSRKADHKFIHVSPHLMFKEALRMMRATLPATIEIEEAIDKECGTILADPTGLHQIIINLCTNAVHSMEDSKGILSLKLYRLEVGEEEIAAEAGVTAGSFVVLVVSDNGCGMDQDTQKQIFEPYFTTKDVGKGTGLGLSVIYGIVKDHNGFIRVESKPGEGSTFYVFFPAVQKVISPSKDSEHLNINMRSDLPRGSERIILVDDELLLVKIQKRQLENLGYTVVATENSTEVLEKIRSHPDQFDVLITDQTMPNLTGEELAEKVLKIKPDMPIIMCTGHSDTVSREDAFAIGIKRYILKPIQGNELVYAVREVLDEK
jgi:two-component system, cell cycle sensor histidine kinase and response regulator CckA